MRIVRKIDGLDSMIVRLEDRDLVALNGSGNVSWVRRDNVLYCISAVRKGLTPRQTLINKYSISSYYTNQLSWYRYSSTKKKK